jgi:multiple sugar transport system permease protein
MPPESLIEAVMVNDIASRAGQRTRKNGGTRLVRREALAGYLFISPWLVGFVIFFIGPTLTSFGLSLTRFAIVTPPVWVGLDNYRYALASDPLVWTALRVTTIYSVAHVALALLCSFLLALLLNQPIRALSVFRVVYYLPVLVPAAASAIMWLWAFNPEFGLINSGLSYLGITGPLWLAHTQWALPTLIIVSLWGVGGPMLIYLAGFQGIPTALYEAASIDGANAWARFVNITIPMMTPVLFFNLVLGVVNSFQVFTTVYLMTQGGPGYATLVFVLYLYQKAFQSYQMGYASALAWILFVIIFLLTLLVVRSSDSWVYYEGRLRGR